MGLTVTCPLISSDVPIKKPLPDWEWHEYRLRLVSQFQSRDSVRAFESNAGSSVSHMFMIRLFLRTRLR